MKPSRPVLRYHGGKYRIAPWVISHFPPHKVYVEPFGGAASVLLQKTPARIEVYNDIDDLIVQLFEVLRDPNLSEQLRATLELTPFSRAEFERCWEISDDPVESCRRLIVRSFQSIGAKGRQEKNGWRTRTSKSVWSPCVAWSGYPLQIRVFTERLKNAIIERLDYRKVFEIYDDSETLWFLDPPYVHSTRSNHHRFVYAHEMTDADHFEFLSLIKELKGYVVLSGYQSQLYETELANWATSTMSTRAQTNSRRTEYLWLNPRVSEVLTPSLFQEAV